MGLEERQGWRLGGVCECNRGFGRAWMEEEEDEELMRCLIEGPVRPLALSERGESQLSSPGLTWDREVMRYRRVRMQERDIRNGRALTSIWRNWKEN